MIEAFLRRWMATDGDCCAMAAEWVALVHGFDPDLPRSGAVLRAWASDPVAVWAPRLASLQRTAAPMRGDVGIVGHSGASRGALCLGGGLWAAPGRRGVGLHVPKAVLAAWSVGYAED